MKLDHLLAGLAEINVQLRQVSKAVITHIESGAPNVNRLDEFDEDEVERKLGANPQSFLRTMATTEEAINYLIHEISTSRGPCPTSLPSGHRRLVRSRRITADRI